MLVNGFRRRLKSSLVECLDRFHLDSEAEPVVVVAHPAQKLLDDIVRTPFVAWRALIQEQKRPATNWPKEPLESSISSAFS